MSEFQISSSERLKAARRRFEELKRKNKIPLSRTSALQTSTVTQNNGYDSTENNDMNNEYSIEHVNELENTIEIQKAQIKKLKDENTELKLESMDLKDKVADLEQALAQLKDEKSVHPEENENSPIIPVNQPSWHNKQEIAQPKETPELAKQPNANTGDYKERVLAWKGWKVDMREWKGCTGSQVAF